MADGVPHPAEAFVDAFGGDEDAVVEIIYTEFAARCRNDRSPSPDEYYLRFPAHADRLRRQFEVHELLESTDGDAGIDEAPPAATPSGIVPHDTSASSHAVTPLCSGGTAAQAATNPIGIHVAGYELTGELGRGATGVVFAARQVGLDRPAAIKMLALSPNADREVLARFRQEARLLAALRHANIVDVIDVVENEQGAFLVMELVRGGNVARHCAGRPQPFDWSVELLTRLARAVHFAHQRGVIHRDLKPANVLLDDGGEPKIADFGLAKYFVRDNGQSTSGCIVGTPSYMAPEQAAGKRDVSPAADVYGLGAILYELLTGRPPFAGESPLDALQQVLQNEPVPPGRLRPKIPPDLETICTKCLRKEPRERYASAAAVADDLERFARLEPIRARPISRLGRVWRWCRRHPTVAVLSTLCAALLVVVAVGSPLAALRLRDEQTATHKNLSRALAAEEDASRKLRNSYLAQARALRWSGREGQRFGSIDAIAKASVLAKDLRLDDDAKLAMRNEAIACLAQVDVRVECEWNAFAGQRSRTGIAFDGDIRRVAMMGEDGFITIVRIDDRQPEQRLSLAAVPSGGRITFAQCVFGPNDDLLVADCSQANGARMIAVWSVASGELLWHLAVNRQSADHPSRFAFTPDGKALATIAADRSLILLDAAAGSLIRRVLPPNRDVRGLAAYPDSTKLCYWTDRTVHVVGIDGDEVARFETPTRGDIVSAAWSDDGHFLAAGTNDHFCHLWDAWEGELRRKFEGHQAWVRHVAFHPDADLLATCAVDGTTRFYDVWSGREELVAAGTICRFSRDGEHAGFGLSGDAIGRWQFAAKSELQILRDAAIGYEAYEYVAVHDNQRLVATKSGNNVTLWDLARRRAVACIDAPRVQHVLFGPKSGDLYSVDYDGHVDRRTVDVHTNDDDLYVTTSDPQQIAKADYGCGTSLSVAGDGQHGKVCLGFQETYKPADASRRPQLLADVDGERFIYYEGLHRPEVSGDGRWIAGGADGDHAVLVVTAATGDVVARLLKGSAGGAVAFRPDGRRLVALTADEFVCLDTGSWEIVYRSDRPAGSKRPVYVTFSPDGEFLVVSESTVGLRLLDATTGVTLALLPSRSGALPHRPTFAADGEKIVTFAERQHVRMWNLLLVRERLDALNLSF